ncbi:MAG: hypothetical protein M3Y30_05630, partial [Gemmatimonadota bacterium]|nr:hypothetical protein [Gemmatimonadota bacterium]
MSDDSLPARSQGRVTSPTRVVKVTAGLSVFGAVVGAAAGAVSMLVATLLTGVLTFDDLIVLSIPAAIGAVLGAVLTPIAGWMLLRRVPLGRAFAGLAAGTIVGGVLGWLLAKHTDPVYASVGSAVAGFLVAAVAMRYS